MRKFLLHGSVWVFVFLMWNRIVYFYISNPINRLYFSALDVSLVVCAFYVVYLYLMPDYLRHKNLWRFAGLSVLAFLSLAAAHAWVMQLMLNHMVVPIHFDFYWNYSQMQANRYFIALAGVLGGCFVKLAVDRIQAQRKIERMEKERSQAELIYLKAQINPHFLFNSLNSLHAQLELSPNEAKGTLVSIADLLRYQLYECNADLIPLVKELAYLENYFNLQSLRADNCDTMITFNGKPGNLSIAPLLLIPFVENAFKYVSDWEEKENFIKLEIRLTGNELTFSCANTFDTGAYIKKQDGNGIGVANVKKRLELIYADKYQLNQTADADVYTINLKLILA